MVLLLLCIVFTVLLFWNIPLNTKKSSITNGFLVKKMSVIIPARNEQTNIERLLSSLKLQVVQPLEIIVVDDQSTDHTKQIAESFGVKVVDSTLLPPQWQGKSWACWNGAEVANGDILVFVDADTLLEKSGLLRIAESYKRQQNRGVLTIHPFHKMNNLYETFSMFFHFIVYASVGASSIWGKLFGLSGGFGQCMVCSRTDYYHLGGHETIKEAIVEHFTFARFAKKQGQFVSAISGKGMINMRMYPDGFKSFIQGWSKSFASGAQASSFISFLMISMWITCLIMFLTESLSHLLVNPILYLLAYGILVLVLFNNARNIGNFTIVDTALFPLHVIVFLFIFVHSVIQTFITKKNEWKGRYIYIQKGEDEEIK